MDPIDELLANASEYAAAYRGESLAVRPARRLAVLACMDSRLVPTRLLGLEEGEAHVIRNAGGVASDDAIRSLAISQHLLGTRGIMVIQHTDCGLLKVTDQEFAQRLEREAGRRPAWRAHAFADLEANVRDTVVAIESSPFLPRTESVRGFVFDVRSGELREVAPAA